MRIITPRVHVEVFRPTRTVPKTGIREGEPTIATTKKFDPGISPNSVRYIKKSQNLEDRRIKGIQFE